MASRVLAEVAPFVAYQPDAPGLATPIPRLTVWSSTRPTPPAQATFCPVFYAVLQGTKALTVGGNRFELTSGDCAAASFGLPFTSQLVEVSHTAPYVATCLQLDTALLIRVMLDMPKREDRWVCSAAGGKLDGAVGEAFIRLVGLLSSPDDIPVLGAHHEAELYYRLLQSSMGDTLRQLGQGNGRIRQIQTAANWLCANLDSPFVGADLAASVGMSLTSFHRHFKVVTGYSPIAFQRHVRLLEARKMLMSGSINVSGAAYAVGYLSTSQFSREYKRMFGTPPLADLASAHAAV
ncbi:MAG: Virulence regulon transcriptional activator VirF [Luteibacter sp.]|nr:MAG: Virulence regulon transcriptional activator VirF [Luteibacter sp.]